jgi:hypothetical protein
MLHSPSLNNPILQPVSGTPRRAANSSANGRLALVLILILIFANKNTITCKEKDQNPVQALKHTLTHAAHYLRSTDESHFHGGPSLRPATELTAHSTVHFQ